MHTRPTRSHCLLLVGLLALSGGCCQTHGVVIPPPPDGSVPTELNQVILPRYVIAPPDILYVQVLQAPENYNLPRKGPEDVKDPNIEAQSSRDRPTPSRSTAHHRSTTVRRSSSTGATRPTTSTGTGYRAAGAAERPSSPTTTAIHATRCAPNGRSPTGSDPVGHPKR